MPLKLSFSFDELRHITTQFVETLYTIARYFYFVSPLFYDILSLDINYSRELVKRVHLDKEVEEKYMLHELKIQDALNKREKFMNYTVW